MATTEDLLARISSKLRQQALPGIEAQVSMAHIGRNDLSEPPGNARKAAVLALLYPSESSRELTLIFIRRSSREPRDRHAGQIAYPGGSVEPGDTSLQHTALREAQEEIGIDPSKVTVFGQLTNLYIPVSNFLVTPFVGYTAKRPDYILQESEVDDVLEIPFMDFLRTDARQVEDRAIANGIKLKNVPYWSVGESTKIWGATAMMTGELVELVT